MSQDPDKYLEKHRDDIDDRAYEVLKGFKTSASSEMADKTIYDYISRFRSIMDRFAWDEFDPKNPSENDFDRLTSRMKDYDGYTTDSYDTSKKVLKAVYREYDNGEHYDKTDTFSVAGSQAEVKPGMILDEKEIQEIIDNLDSMRNKAFCRLMYETATTPGEILKNKVSDVDLQEETIYIRGNKDHQSQKMELLPKGLKYLKEYLKSRPKVDDIYSLTSSQPLWYQQNYQGCGKCGNGRKRHQLEEKGEKPDDADWETCGDYSRSELKPAGYRTFYKAFRRAVEKSSIKEEDIEQGQEDNGDRVKMKYFRKSMLTRMAKELSFEELNTFARWKPGSTQAKHYISLNNDEVRKKTREVFKGKTEEETPEKVKCEICGAMNPPGSMECRRCERYLDAVKSKSMEKAEKIANKLAQFSDEEIESAMKVVQMKENPEDFIDKKIEQKIQEMEN